MDSVRNEMKMCFLALPVNEALARVCVAGFLLPLNLPLQEMEDIKTAVSEAVTNSVVHGYGLSGRGKINLHCVLRDDGNFCMEVTDQGVGISDVSLAMEPLYTSDPKGERSGMGFTVMQSFMDRIKVTSCVGKGTSVYMEKRVALPRL